MTWIERMPKVELHCHLDGSIPVSVLKRLCLMGDVESPKDDEEFRKCIEAGEDCESLTEYLRAFDLPLRCLRTEEAFFVASYETVANAAKEGVRYLELRFAPLLSETSRLPAESIIEAAAAGLEKAVAECDINAAFILCGMRHFKETENLRTLKLAKKYLYRGVCGLDLAGDESSYPNEAFREYFQKASREDVPVTIHSGECGRKENIELAVEYGAVRIGHGIAMKGDVRLQEKIAASGIGIEICPSSNLQTKAVAGWEDYPFREFLDRGVNLSVNTDNRTVTNTTMIKELKLLHGHFNLTPKEAVELMKRSVDVSFAQESTKKTVKKQIDESDIA